MTFETIFLCCLEIISFIGSIRWAKTFAFLKLYIQPCFLIPENDTAPHGEKGYDDAHLGLTSHLEGFSPNSPGHN